MHRVKRALESWRNFWERKKKVAIKTGREPVFPVSLALQVDSLLLSHWGSPKKWDLSGNWLLVIVLPIINAQRDVAVFGLWLICSSQKIPPPVQSHSPPVWLQFYLPGRIPVSHFGDWKYTVSLFPLVLYISTQISDSFKNFIKNTVCIKNTVLQWTLGYTCLFQFWFPWCVCPAVRLLGHMAVLFPVV